MAADEGYGALTPERCGWEVMQRLRETDRAQTFMRRRVWPRNALYDEGKQDIRFDVRALTWVRNQRAKRYERQTANLLGARGDHWVSDLSQGMPAYAGLPENKDLESRRIAKLGERLVTSDWRRCNMESARLLALRDVWRFGAGFIETCWDEQAGAIVPEYDVEKDERGEPRLNALNLPVYKRKRDGSRKQLGLKAKGAVVDRAVSPLLVYVPITTEVPLMEACAWVIRLEWTTLYRLRQMATIELEDDWVPADDFQFRYTDDFLASLGSGERQIRSSDSLGLHLAVHYYELRKPVEGFRYGKHYIVAGETAIVDEELQGYGDERGDRYPIFMLAGRPRARTFWPQPEIQDRIDSQRRRNQILTHEITYLGRFAMPTPVAAKESAIPDHVPFDGSTLFYNGTYERPGILPIPPPAPNLFNGKDAAAAELDQVGGDEPASRGVAVSAPSALYVQYLQDAAAKRLGPLVRQHAWSWARLGEFHCQLHAAYEPDEKILSVIGRRNRPELVSLRMADLGNVRFHVQESSLSVSIPSARIGQLQTVVPTLFGPPPYPPQALRAFLDFVRMPDMLDLETGTSAIDDWVDNLVTRVVDEGKSSGIDPAALEPTVEAPAVMDGLMRRKYGGDFFDWDEETRARFDQFQAAVQAVIQQAQQAQAQQADEDTQKQVAAQVGFEQGKSDAKTEGGLRLAYGKARAAALGKLMSPPPPPSPAGPPGTAPTEGEHEE